MYRRWFGKIKSIIKITRRVYINFFVSVRDFDRHGSTVLEAPLGRLGAINDAWFPYVVDSGPLEPWINKSWRPSEIGLVKKEWPASTGLLWVRIGIRLIKIIVISEKWRVISEKWKVIHNHPGRTSIVKGDPTQLYSFHSSLSTIVYTLKMVNGWQ